METARQLFNVNVFGVLDVTQAFGPLLIASKGIIVNAGSVVGRVPMPFCGVYNASKAALDSLSKQMRIELAPFDIRVIHVWHRRTCDSVRQFLLSAPFFFRFLFFPVLASV